MSTSKEKILNEINRLAKSNGGISPSKGIFEQETGIKESDWLGRYWTKWSDALIEAGYEPNLFGTPAYEEEYVLEKVAGFTRELGHFPNRNEIRLRKRSDPRLPTDVTIRKKFGSKQGLTAKMLVFVESNREWSDLVPIVKAELETYDNNTPELDAEASGKAGYVYLMQHGNRKEYKFVSL